MIHRSGNDGQQLELMTDKGKENWVVARMLQARWPACNQYRKQTDLRTHVPWLHGRLETDLPSYSVFCNLIAS